jgi:ribosomal protein S27E
MKAGTFFGYKCPRCESKSDIIAIIGSDEIRCPNCGTTMVPDPNGKTSTANAYCPNCNSFSALINSDKCPTCGRLFSGIK